MGGGILYLSMVKIFFYFLTQKQVSILELTVLYRNKTLSVTVRATLKFF